MEGGIGILLIVLIIVAAVAAVFLFGVARAAARKPTDDQGSDGNQPDHRVPHAEQQRKEKGTAFPARR
jgi:flagellar basal body-associated protein FliL